MPNISVHDLIGVSESRKPSRSATSIYLKENNATTTINMGGGFAQAATALTVTDGSVFPATGNFLITLWDKSSYVQPGDDGGMEIVLCTGVAGNILTVVRAQEGTADVNHANAEAVELLVTVAQIDQLSTAINDLEDRISTVWNQLQYAPTPLYFTDTGIGINTDAPTAKLHIIHAGTTNNGMNIYADALTTGSIAYFYSDSSSTSTRNLVDIVNDNTAAIGATCLAVRQDAVEPAIYSTVYANAPALNLYGNTGFNTGNLLYVSAGAITTGKLAYFYSNTAEISTRNLVDIVNDNAAATGATCLHIQQDANEAALYIDQNGIGAALQIDSDSTTADSIYATCNSQTTGNALQIRANGLTTGAVAYFYSDSSETDARNLVEIVNDHSAAVGAVLLGFDQDANALTINVDTQATTDGMMFVQANAMTTGSVFEVDADALTTGRILYLHSSSTSISTRNLVEIVNDNAAAVGATCLAVRQDAAEPAIYSTVYANAAALSLYGNTGFGTADLFYVSAGAITTGRLAHFYSNNASASARTLVQITNDHSSAVNAYCFYIKQDADYNAVYVEANVSTYYGLYVRADSLTTGQACRFVSNSSDTGAFQVVGIFNDNVLATGATCLHVQQDSINAAIDINCISNAPHIRLRGDPTVAAPSDGDIWFDGTNVKIRIGATTYNFDVTSV